MGRGRVFKRQSCLGCGRGHRHHHYFARVRIDLVTRRRVQRQLEETVRAVLLLYCHSLVLQTSGVMWWVTAPSVAAVTGLSWGRGLPVRT